MIYVLKLWTQIMNKKLPSYIFKGGVVVFSGFRNLADLTAYTLPDLLERGTY